jgi:hypothetical protein
MLDEEEEWCGLDHYAILQAKLTLLPCMPVDCLSVCPSIYLSLSCLWLDAVVVSGSNRMMRFCKCMLLTAGVICGGFGCVRVAGGFGKSGIVGGLKWCW